MSFGPGIATTPSLPVPAVPAVPIYSLVAVGPPRSGKSALLRLLLDTSPISPHATPAQLDSLARFLTPPTAPAFSECEVELLWEGERVLLRLIDTPPLDYTAEEDVERTLRDILTLVEDRYIDSARDRDDDGESHIHLCLYVLDPARITPPTLNPHEISAIRKLSKRVNVLPVLGRSDAITVEHLTALKRSVRANLAEAGLGFGIFDEEGEAAVAPTATASTSAAPTDSASSDDASLPLLPFAIFAPESYHGPCTSSRREIAAKFASRVVTSVEDVHGNSHTLGHTSKSPSHPISDARSPLHDSKSPLQHSLLTLSSKPPSPQAPSPHTYDQDAYLPRGTYTRQFRWGVLDCLDRRHSDFCALRRAVMDWRKELKTYTKDYLYGKFKVESLLAQRPQAPHPHAHQLSPRAQYPLPPHSQHHLSTLPAQQLHHPAYIHHPHHLEREQRPRGGGDVLLLSRDIDMDRERDTGREHDINRGRSLDGERGMDRERDLVQEKAGKKGKIPILSPTDGDNVRPFSQQQAHVSPQDRDIHISPRDRDMHVSPRDRDMHVSPRGRDIHFSPRDHDMVSPRDRDRDIHISPRDRNHDMHISPRAHEREMISPRDRDRDHDRDRDREIHIPRDREHISPHAHPREMHIPLHIRDRDHDRHTLPPPHILPHSHTLLHNSLSHSLPPPQGHTLSPHQRHHEIPYHHDPRPRLPPIRMHHYDDEEVGQGVPIVGQGIQGVGVGGQGTGPGQGQGLVVGGQGQGQGGQPAVVGLTANGRKRKITMACNFCRSRKLKCDGLRPACAQCVKRSNICDYQPHTHSHTQTSTSSASASTPASASQPTSNLSPNSATQAPSTPTPISSAPPHPHTSPSTHAHSTSTSTPSTTSASHLSTWRYTAKQRDSDVDELEDDGEDWGVGIAAGPTSASGAGVTGSGVGVTGVGIMGTGMGMMVGGGSAPVAVGTGTVAGGRKRVSVDMLIAETLGEREIGTGMDRDGERGGREREREKERARERDRDGDRPRPRSHSRMHSQLDLDLLDEHIPDRDPAATPSNTTTPTPAGRNHSRSHDTNPKPHDARSKSHNAHSRSHDAQAHSKSHIIKSEDRERERWEVGMGVLDVGSEGDKKKRLNRQSANYGSKAVACVHCRARKTRCDATRPACGNCSRRSLLCSYIHTTPSQPRTKGKKEKTVAAKEREKEKEKREGSDASGINVDMSTLNTLNGSGAANTYLSLSNLGVGVKQREGEGSEINSNRRSGSIAMSKRDGSDTPSERSVWTSAKAGVEVVQDVSGHTDMDVDVDMGVNGAKAAAVEESAERQRPLPKLNSNANSHMSSSRSPPYQQPSQSQLHIHSSPPPIATLPVSASTDTTPAPTPRSGSEGAVDERAHGQEQVRTHIRDERIQTQMQPIMPPQEHMPNVMDKRPPTPQDTPLRLSVDISDVRSHPAPTPVTRVSPQLQSQPPRRTPPQNQNQTPTPPPQTHTPPPVTNGAVPNINGAIAAPNMPPTKLINGGVPAVTGKRKTPDASDELDSDDRDRPDKKMKWMEIEEQQGLKGVRVQ